MNSQALNIKFIILNSILQTILQVVIEKMMVSTYKRIDKLPFFTNNRLFLSSLEIPNPSLL